MVHATDRKPKKKENTLEPHPEPSVKWVKTHVAGCLSGVRYSRAMQMQMVAQTDGCQNGLIDGGGKQSYC